MLKQNMELTISNPILRQKGGLYYYLAIWTILSILQIFILTFFLKLPWLWALLDSIMYNGFYAILGLSIWYPCKFISLEKESVMKILLSHALASAFIAALWLTSAYLILNKLSVPNDHYKHFLVSSIPWRFLLGLLFYLIIASFYYLLIYYHHFREEKVKESELKTLVKEAQLKTLKFQINPHFIFNSLNSINSLTQTDPQKAGEMTVKLGDFLRYTLSNNEAQKNRLDEELKSAKLYLDIEKVRFGDKLEYVEDIDQQCLELPVPNMILQPLFENAIKHGVYESLDKVIIKFLCKPFGDYLKITVENDYDPEVITKKGEGIGLINIQNRLEMLYNQRNLLKVEKESRLFRVNIYIPLDTS